MSAEYAQGIADGIQRQCAQGADAEEAHQQCEESVRSALLAWEITEKEGHDLSVFFDEFFPYHRSGLAGEGAPNE